MDGPAGRCCHHRDMIKRVGRRLRMVFRPHAEGRSSAVGSVPDTRLASRAVELVAYGEDFVVSGQMQVDADRLTDIVEGDDEYLLTWVLLERRDQGPAQAVSERWIEQYDIRGYLQAIPGPDPLKGIGHRETMVPLTDARIGYESASSRPRRRVGTLVVNRDQFAHAESEPA